MTADNMNDTYRKVWWATLAARVVLTFFGEYQDAYSECQADYSQTTCHSLLAQWNKSTLILIMLYLLMGLVRFSKAARHTLEPHIVILPCCKRRKPAMPAASLLLYTTYVAQGMVHAA